MLRAQALKAIMVFQSGSLEDDAKWQRKKMAMG
jgi:hypothetical protein